jgi:hypothetical protein
MKIKLKVQSFSDIITNSSSELFVVKDDRSYETVKEIIERVAETNLKNGTDVGSGMGQFLEIKNWEMLYDEAKEDHIAKNKQEFYTPEIWSLEYEEELDELKQLIYIDIDWRRDATIEWIFKNLFVSNIDYGYAERDPETGRILRTVSEETFNSLPADRQYEK